MKKTVKILSLIITVHRQQSMSVSALTINGFKRYTFKDGYLQKYYDLMTVEK